MSVTANFTNGKPWVATADDVKFKWNCAPNGEAFRCGLCGHKFILGDTVRWQYTNDMPGAGGNPFVCIQCDGPDVRERWAAIHAEWNAMVAGRFWWFSRMWRRS